MTVTKTLKMGCLGIIVMMILGGVFIYKSTTSHIKMQKAIDDMPEFTGVVQADSSLTAPFSGEKGAVIRFEVSCNYYNQGAGNSRTHRHNDELNFFAEGARFIMNGKVYKIEGNRLEGMLYGGKLTDNEGGPEEIDERFYGKGSCLDLALYDAAKKLQGKRSIKRNKNYHAAHLKEYIHPSGTEMTFKGKIKGDSVILYSVHDAAKTADK